MLGFRISGHIYKLSRVRVLDLCSDPFTLKYSDIVQGSSRANQCDQLVVDLHRNSMKILPDLYPEADQILSNTGMIQQSQIYVYPNLQKVGPGPGVGSLFKIKI